MQSKTPYRGRLAPSPTGYLHVGHAVTFWRAQERSRARNGKLFLRIEDLDRDRCRPEFRTAILEDLEWFGFRWEAEPVLQSERRPLYLAAWKQLRDRGLIYPCTCTRRDVLAPPVRPMPKMKNRSIPALAGPLT